MEKFVDRATYFTVGKMNDENTPHHQDIRLEGDHSKKNKS